ncbi:MAG: YdcF family protein [Chloroflexota bacterium]|nr:YdcF family protein [Chloroflexota bacterium]MDQ5866177.1 YdcF family protein [Chloroflexota bacterium]
MIVSKWLWLVRRLVGLLAAVGLVVLVWSSLVLLYVCTDNVTDYAVPSDVIIILGCPSYERNVLSTTFSACVQARAHHAARLYHKGLARHIIPTGGFTGPPPSEAGAMAQVLMSDGVPPEAITLEEQARSTVQNIQFSRAIMQQNGWKTAILVTEPHHIKRAAVIARDGGLDITISPVTDSPGWNTPNARHQNLLGDARNLMLYQLGRLRRGPP